MKKIISVIIITAIFFVAFSTKPDDKTCILRAVKAVWGSRTPPEDKPLYFEQFMNLTSKSVKIIDWLFFKQIKYKMNNDFKTVGFGAFNKVFIT